MLSPCGFLTIAREKDYSQRSNLKDENLQANSHLRSNNSRAIAIQKGCYPKIKSVRVNIRKTKSRPSHCYQSHLRVGYSDGSEKILIRGERTEIFRSLIARGASCFEDFVLYRAFDLGDHDRE